MQAASACTGYWILVGHCECGAGSRMLDTGYWMLDTGYWVLDAGFFNKKKYQV
jgi:hypothetical protein